jgi:hypothetical protein
MRVNASASISAVVALVVMMSAGPQQRCAEFSIAATAVGSQSTCLRSIERESCCADLGALPASVDCGCACPLVNTISMDSSYHRATAWTPGYRALVGLGPIRCEYLPVVCTGLSNCCKYGEPVLIGLCGDWVSPMFNFDCP